MHYFLICRHKYWQKYLPFTVPQGLTNNYQSIEEKELKSVKETTYQPTHLFQ